ncbi:MAG: PIG-L family deacetylase [Acidimicrobiales bacterium]
MSTLVAFHAHPDDESILTGGTLAHASADGHRVVVVVATGGELGEVPTGLIGTGEQLAQRRAGETARAARVLGVHRVELLGYRDSGMAGRPSNDDPSCFWRADPALAARRLADILDQESPDVLTIYDDHGVTGHPDHIQVHRVGALAARLVRVGRVYEATMDREAIASLVAQAAAAGLPEPPDIDVEHLGSHSAVITTRVDVGAHLDRKRQAIAAHASQVSETSLLLSMPTEAFHAFAATECYVRGDGRSEPLAATSLFGPR